ncbi:MAG: hypothetical protein RLZZ546_2061 [Bacteroidota bacterium]|jgi:hypothetical protein
MDLKINRPEPSTPLLPLSISQDNMSHKEILDQLYQGKPTLLSGSYNHGLSILNYLNSHLNKIHNTDTYKEQRKLRLEYKKLSNLIFVRIVSYKIALTKAPFIGWLQKLYPDQLDFMLSLPQIQGLNSAWQWYENGIHIPGLRNKIHPYYGVYFPTRFEHLILFDTWLKHYAGLKKSAIDVGIGSGILSLFIIQHGFQKSYGTDINPNAILGMKEMMGETKLSRKIELEHAYLFGKCEKQTELIVFNPPWLPSSHILSRLDEAIFYPENLFSDFFERAQKLLLPEGRILLLFSNLGQITDENTSHPIENELKEEKRFDLERCYKKKVKSNSKFENQNWRSLEVVELWVLKHKTPS